MTIRILYLVNTWQIQRWLALNKLEKERSSKVNSKIFSLNTQKAINAQPTTRTNSSRIPSEAIKEMRYLASHQWSALDPY